MLATLLALLTSNKRTNTCKENEKKISVELTLLENKFTLDFNQNISYQYTSNHLIKSCIKQALNIREKWMFNKTKPNYNSIKKLLKNNKKNNIQHKITFKFVDGVIQLYKNNKEIFQFDGFSMEHFLNDLQTLIKIENNKLIKNYVIGRFENVSNKFKKYKKKEPKLNENVFKKCNIVDNHIHHSASFTQKHLIEFIKKIYIRDARKLIKLKNGEYITLENIFKNCGITINNISKELLNMHCEFDDELFNNFDKFKDKFNPCGEKLLRELFLRYINTMNGQYLAELTKENINYIENVIPNTFYEYRLSINGKNTTEWNELANWVINNDICSKNVKFLIQIPRKYDINKKSKYVDSFHEMLNNIFTPLIDVTLNPKKNKNLYALLQMIIGFDSVDDESVVEYNQLLNLKPNEIKCKENVPYIMYIYYMYINIMKLNKIRTIFGLNTFALRPHSGESNNDCLQHLLSCYMLSDSINHGIQLSNNVVTQYLYYLKQIGLSVSPKSNDALFKKYKDNPFPTFLQHGLNVTLSTDDPLIFHNERNSLLEEYTLAKKHFKLNNNDLVEIAQNSINQSGFNDIGSGSENKIRHKFRNKLLNNELGLYKN